jgi:hypothetical protein
MLDLPSTCYIFVLLLVCYTPNPRETSQALEKKPVVIFMLLLACYIPDPWIIRPGENPVVISMLLLACYVSAPWIVRRQAMPRENHVVSPMDRCMGKSLAPG